LTIRAPCPTEIRSLGDRAVRGHSYTQEAFMFGLGFPELLLILVIVVLIFGTSRIPELGRGLGEGIRNFRRGMKGDEEEKKP
jgi:sec-independent protein translocase protein TatA